MPAPLTGLDHALLGLLAKGPASGYDLRRLFQDTPMGAYSDSPGSIYPALRRLETRGLIRGGATRSLRRRRRLAITTRGRTILVGWLTSPLTVDDIRRGRGEVELRLAFLSDHAGAPAVHLFLVKYASLLEAQRTQVARARRMLAGTLSPSARLALDLGLTILGARAAWCRRAARRITEP